MKKAIALLVAAMLLTGLSACGGSTTADAPAKSDGTSKTETNKEECVLASWRPLCERCFSAV